MWILYLSLFGKFYMFEKDFFFYLPSSLSTFFLPSNKYKLVCLSKNLFKNLFMYWSYCVGYLYTVRLGTCCKSQFHTNLKKLLKKCRNSLGTKTQLEKETND